MLGEPVAVAVGVSNPWMLIGNVSSLILLVFIADATLTVWRRGEHRKALTLGARSDGNGMIEVTVSDCGHGVPPEKLGHLFEPFFTTKPQGMGMGMGLPISRTIVEAHGGPSGRKTTSIAARPFDSPSVDDARPLHPPTLRLSHRSLSRERDGAEHPLLPVLPTPSSSRSGIATPSRACRSPWRKASASRGAGGSTKRPARRGRWCRITCSRPLRTLR